MHAIFYRFLHSVRAIFSGRNLIWHAAAILLTIAIIFSGFDWYYFRFWNTHYFAGGIWSVLFFLSFMAAVIGGVLPVLAPPLTIFFGILRKNTKMINVGVALIQAVGLASLLSAFFKAITNRAHPEILHTLGQDVTHIFHFGFLKNSVFWGWPSSHTTVAFAMALTLWGLFPKHRVLKITSFLYALFIGLGVSTSIHWFSDFVAGMLLGIVIGRVVGASFKKRHLPPVRD